AVGGRYGRGMAGVTRALRRLVAAGRVVEGECLPAGTAGEQLTAAQLPQARGTEWCDAEVLRLLRRRCLARLRKEAEPVPPEVLGTFLPAWQNAGQPGTARGGAPGPGRGRRVARAEAGGGAVGHAAGGA